MTHTRCLHPMDDRTKAECAEQQRAYADMCNRLGLVSSRKIGRSAR